MLLLAMLKIALSCCLILSITANVSRIIFVYSYFSEIILDILFISSLKEML